MKRNSILRTTLFPAALLAAAALCLWAPGTADAQRKKKGLPALKEAGRPPRWLRTAEKKGLGVGDLAKISVVSG